MPDPQPKWFVGTAVNKLDPKGRLFLPVRMRPLLAGTLYLTRHMDGCLRLFTEEVFSAEAERQRGLLRGGVGDRDSVRVLAPATEVCVLDGQGRLAVPPQLRLLAGLQPDGQVVVAGMIDFVELWSEEGFAEMEARASGI